jgi:hypothetical protein
MNRPAWERDVAYNRDAYYLTFGGPLFQTEIWQCGIKFTPTSGEDIFEGAFSNISMSDIADDLRTWMTSGSNGAQIGSSARLAWAKLAVLDKAGHFKFDPMSEEITPEVMPPQTTVYPAQVAYCVTLWSGGRLGRANYGRFYVPVPSMIVGQQSEGVMTTTNAFNAAAAATAMINAVNGEIDTVGINTRPAIYSKVGTGTTKVAQYVSVGRALDTQRRRRNSLQEGHNYIEL